MEDNSIWFFYGIWFIAGCIATAIFFWIGRAILGTGDILEELREIRKIMRDKTPQN